VFVRFFPHHPLPYVYRYPPEIKEFYQPKKCPVKRFFKKTTPYQPFIDIVYDMVYSKKPMSAAGFLI